ncbi:MAG: hypothetical protein D6682_04585 [Zetaproteobacteria bacterium]|nr:MAG: hypothetical protein D6682_04585 [Zetaproteobacteria bacterium]
MEIMLSGELLTTDDQLRLAAVLDALPMPQRVDPGLNGAWRKHVAQCGVVWWQKEASAGDRRAPHAHAPSAVRPDGGGR